MNYNTFRWLSSAHLSAGTLEALSIAAGCPQGILDRCGLRLAVYPKGDDGWFIVPLSDIPVGISKAKAQAGKNLDDLKFVMDIFRDAELFVFDEDASLMPGLPIFDTQPASENTKVSYMYRDASNSKLHCEAILTSTLPIEDVQAAVLPKLDKGTYFIPHQVGLPEPRFGEEDTEDDHPWYEWGGVEIVSAPPTEQMSIQELVDNFAAISEWDENCCIN